MVLFIYERCMFFWFDVCLAGRTMCGLATSVMPFLCSVIPLGCPLSIPPTSGDSQYMRRFTRGHPCLLVVTNGHSVLLLSPLMVSTHVITTHVVVISMSFVGCANDTMSRV
jgi:hypothetical protein